MNIKRNKISKKTRLFTSKTRSTSNLFLPKTNRPSTGLTRKIILNTNIKTSPKKIFQQKSTSSINIDFKEGLDFRSVGPKSRIQDKIFNSYWELKLISPRTFIKRKNFDENENNKNDLYLQKSMQEKMQLYKYPQINWRNKNPSNFLNHIGGNEVKQCQSILQGQIVLLLDLISVHYYLIEIKIGR